VSAAEQLLGDLDRRLARAQAEHRVPGLTAAVFRGDDLVWSRALGLADVETGAAVTPAHAFRIGSVTKTFTAVCVMQLREQGAVDLDEPLRRYVPEAPVGPTVRQALAHMSGIQREPPGDVWETMVMPGREELLARLEDAEQVLRPGERWHYSNLAFGLLGELVARLAGGSYPDALRRGVLDPLGLARTALTPLQPVARGYLVDAYADGVSLEPEVEMVETTAALGQLWSTATDLCRYGAFLADGCDGVLPRAALDEMARVQTMVDHERWTVAWGLGLELVRVGERLYAGHGGAMPGFLASLMVCRQERIGAAVLVNSGAQVPIEKIALDLAELACAALPPDPESWSPDGGAPEELRPLLGRWWTEGHEMIVRIRRGRLEAELVGGPPGRSVSVFERESPDRWRCVEGREQGELLRVERLADGSVEKLSFATYPLTRSQQTFG
jgi:CubicO group peptidase (beta-lactamase class C family)